MNVTDWETVGEDWYLFLNGLIRLRCYPIPNEQWKAEIIGARTIRLEEPFDSLKTAQSSALSYVYRWHQEIQVAIFGE